MPAKFKIRASTLAAVWCERAPSKMDASSVEQNGMSDDLQVGTTKEERKKKKKERTYLPIWYVVIERNGEVARPVRPRVQGSTCRVHVVRAPALARDA